MPALFSLLPRLALAAFPRSVGMTTTEVRVGRRHRVTRPAHRRTPAGPPAGRAPREQPLAAAAFRPADAAPKERAAAIAAPNARAPWARRSVAFPTRSPPPAGGQGTAAPRMGWTSAVTVERFRDKARVA